jgi:hypothetical protein
MEDSLCVRLCSGLSSSVWTAIAGWHKYMLYFWRLEVQDQGASMVIFWQGLSSHGVLTRKRERERERERN